MDQTSFGNTHAYYGDSTQLLYLRARHYAPGMGRFITSDPAKATNNLYAYTNSNPINYTDPTGLFSKRDVAAALWFTEPAQPDNFGLFLDNMEYFARNGGAHPKWGFVAALLDANEGDRLEAKRLSIWGFNQSAISSLSIFTRPSLVSAADTVLHNNRSDLWRLYFSTIVRDPYDARYYILHSQNGGVKYYVDGSNNTEYPDFKIATFNVADSLKEGIKLLVKDLGKFGCLSYTRTKIVDRFGQVYSANTLNIGLSFSLATLGEGWITRPSYSISDAATLRSNLQGFSIGVNISLFTGGSFSYSPGTGSVTGVGSFGLQGGFSVDPTLIQYEYTDSSLAWDSANQWEMGAYGSPPTIFRSTLSTWNP